MLINKMLKINNNGRRAYAVFRKIMSAKSLEMLATKGFRSHTEFDMASKSPVKCN